MWHLYLHSRKYRKYFRGIIIAIGIHTFANMYSHLRPLCLYGYTCCILTPLMLIQIFAVKLKSGPIFALFKVKKWSNLFVLGVFIFQKSRSPCRKKMIFEKHAKNNKKTQFLKLKSGPIMLRNIIGPLFNFNLDHFLTLEFCFFFFFFAFFWLKPLFYSVFSKKCKLKETQKGKKTLFVNTTVLTALVKMSVFFFCIFDFCCFSNFHVFQRCF